MPIHASAVVLFPLLFLAAAPPGRPYVLTVEGENTITFVPRANLDPMKIDYKVRIEYLVNTRTGEAELARAEAAAKKKTSRKASAPAKAKRKEKGKDADADSDAPAPAKAVAAVDIAVHSSEMRSRQNGNTVVESRMTRSRFQGRLQPDAPVVKVWANEAPPRLQDILKTFDTTSATILIDEDSKVIDRKVRSTGPFHAVTETLLSIHTPIPRDVGFWEAPTQLAMGQGQTAKGTLRFEKEKEAPAKTGGVVKVKVSGVLKAEGVVVGKLIKDGTYTVTGEQTYDPSTRAWKTAKWNVEVTSELANAGGQTVAHARGTMTVNSQSLDDGLTSDPKADKPKSADAAGR